MVQAAANAAAVGGADDHRHGPIAVGAVAHLGRLADDLVESRVDKIGKLNFADGAHAVQGCADAHPHDGQFRQGGIDHALRAVFIKQAHSGAENAPAHAHILAHDEHVGVAGHFLIHRHAHSVNQGHLRHGAPPPHTPGRQLLPPPDRGLFRRKPRRHPPSPWRGFPSLPVRGR